MSEISSASTFEEHNHRYLTELVRGFSDHQGEFKLWIALCGSVDFRGKLIDELIALSPCDILQIDLQPPLFSLAGKIQAELSPKPADVLMIRGLEKAQSLEQLFMGANRVRDAFQEHFPLPMVMWVTEPIFKKLGKYAPDFVALATLLDFKISSESYVSFIRETADRVFNTILESKSSWYQEHADYIPGTNSSLKADLQAAYKALTQRGHELEAEYEAGLEFVLAQETDFSTPPCRLHYESSLKLWQKCENLPRMGVTLFYLGLGWRLHGARNESRRQYSYNRSMTYFQNCLEVFEKARRPEWAARTINFLAGVLQRLQRWDILAEVIEQSMNYHASFPDAIMLARTYGFMAELALAKDRPEEARGHAHKALATLEAASMEGEIDTTAQSIAERAFSFHRGWYLYSLAKSYQTDEHIDRRLEYLNLAREATKAQYEPELYINILKALREGYFRKKLYKPAFSYHQEQKTVEQEFGLQAFIGAGRLKPNRQILKLSPSPMDYQQTTALEIRHCNRLHDVERLMDRLHSQKSPLIILHGPSGVGKSSLIQAGLIPTMNAKYIDGRRLTPILLQEYGDWHLSIAKKLGILSLSVSKDLLLAKIGQTEDHIIFIFDQLEEFFTISRKVEQRTAFFEFLSGCLAINHVKIILALREEFLHLLLEWERHFDLKLLDHDLLSNKQRFYLGSLKKAETLGLLKQISEAAQFKMEPELLQQLTEELSDPMGRILPMELQVVGAQLQNEHITTLEQYRQRGPKSRLVARWLEAAIEQCGPENEEMAWAVLFLLTSETHVQPIKTSLELEIALKRTLPEWSGMEARNFSIVLEILVHSGLLYMFPEYPNNRYQLIHDYLSPFIRKRKPFH